MKQRFKKSLLAMVFFIIPQIVLGDICQQVIDDLKNLNELEKIDYLHIEDNITFPSQNLKVFIVSPKKGLEDKCSFSKKLIVLKNDNIVYSNSNAILNNTDYSGYFFNKLKKTKNDFQMEFEFGSIIYCNFIFTFTLNSTQDFDLSEKKYNCFNKANPDIYKEDTIAYTKKDIKLQNFNVNNYLEIPNLLYEEFISLSEAEIYSKTNKLNFLSLDNLLKKFSLKTTTLTQYNNIAYYLEQAEAYKESAYLLEKILEKYPDRTVAHYNLGDAYWGLGEKEKAIASYNTYIQQMKANGKEKRIPQVVLDRVNTKEAVK